MSTLFDLEEVPERNAKSNEWYTQKKYVEAVRRVLGSIDLDPASCEMANKTVKATRYYTKEDNGLMQPWYGRVYMNPPYTRTPEMRARHESTIERFAEKLCNEYRAGNVTQAIALLTAQIDSRWFQGLWDFPICFSGYKVHFNTPETRSSYNHMFGVVFVYLGPNIDKFVEHFTEFGPVVTPDGVHRRPQPLPQPTLWSQGDLA